MDVDVVGRVNNIRLPENQVMLPIYEALINSLQALEPVDTSLRSIVISVVRDHTQEQLSQEEGPYFLPIKDVLIVDGGIGFTGENFASFQTSDTTLKRDRGGKGIGRFLWLKAFERVHIDSVFAEQGRKQRRQFDFVLTKNGIDNHSLDKEVNKVKEQSTTVSLIGLRENYRKNFPKKIQTIGYQILEHLLAYFIFRNPPSIRVVDNETSEEIELRDLYEREVAPNLVTSSLQIKGTDFAVYFVKLYSSMASLHRIHYCAHGREVRSEELREYIPLLSGRLTDGTGLEFLILAYVSSAFLDGIVNPERTAFYVSEDGTDESLLSAELPSLKDIRNAVIEKIKTTFGEYIEPLRKTHCDKIEKFVREENPEYRTVLKYKSAEIEKIPSNLAPDKLELELHKLSQNIEYEIKKDSNRLLSMDEKTIRAEPEYQKAWEEFLSKVNDFGKDKLVKYVLHRNIVLRMLERRLQLQETGSYEREDSIHELVFPLRSTSEEVEYNKQNLWIIDEKLAYHYFLASDTPLRQIPVTESRSSKRPDLVIFNNPMAFVEDQVPYSSVVIIEFKRPLREEYAEAENPIIQVQNYIREIKNGKTKDRNGRPLTVQESTPVYAYLLCDITDKIREFAENHSFTKTPDAIGYFGFNPNLNCYIEIISFDKLLNDAKKRNKVLFEKLGLPSQY